jgi:hypothetical protein
VLGDGLGALELLSAFLATILVSRHDFLRCVRLTHRDARPWSVLSAIKGVGDRRETNPDRAVTVGFDGFAVSGARARFRDVLGLSLAFGRRELLKLLLAHRAKHFLRGALKAAGISLPTFGSKRNARRFLLGSRFGLLSNLRGHMEFGSEKRFSIRPVPIR